MTETGLNLTFLIDLIMLSALAFTIFYAIRLSGQLKILKHSKSDLEQLVSNLSVNINRAQDAIQEMHDVATDSGTNLQNLISNGEALSQELQIIMQAGENIANRMENASSKTAHSYNEPDELDEYLTRTMPDSLDDLELDISNHNSNAANTADSPFFIRDKEFELPQTNTSRNVKKSSFYDELENHDNDEDEEEDEFEKFSSYAERHLALALKNKQH